MQNIKGGEDVEVIINEIAKEKLENTNLKDKYIKIYHGGFG